MLLLSPQIPIFYRYATKIQDEDRQKLFEAIGWLNTYLDGHKYVAGTDFPTLADISLFNSVANIVVSYYPIELLNQFREPRKTSKQFDLF